MTEMGTDDPSNDFLGYPTELTEFMKTLRAKPESEATKPLIVYSPNPDPWAFLLKGIQKTTVKPNPCGITELIERCRDRELIDMYEERRQRERGETPEVNLRAIEALRKSELIDLYQERRLRKRK
jgi:hypothetical protein